MNNKKLCSIVIILGMLAAALPALASSLANWGAPENLSEWQSTIYETRLEMAADGTLGAFWVSENSAGGKYGLWARFREPGQPWSPPEEISGWFDPLSIAAPTFWGAGMALDGTAWVMWSATDSSIVPPADNQFVYAANKSPGGAWQTDTLHGPITNISDAKMDMSPNGDVVVTWVETAGAHFMMHERHRFAGVMHWENLIRIDAAVPNTDIQQMYPLVGNGGMVVILWGENEQFDPTKWGVMWRAFDPGSMQWTPVADRISDWSTHINLGQPDMGPDGTVVAAWTQTLPSGKYVNVSTTRPVSTGVWTTPPTQISQEKSGVALYPPHLAVGEGGTVAAAWTFQPSGPQHVLFANARDATAIWGSEQQISSAQSLIYLMDVGVWPNGDALVAWSALDNTLPAGGDTAIFWSQRKTTALWGSQQQLGGYVDDIYGIALGLGNDFSGHLLWSLQDTTRPSGQDNNIYAARYDPTGAWDTPIPISEWDKFTYVNHDGLTIGPAGMPVGADWVVERNSSPSDAVFFNEIPPPPPTPTPTPTPKTSPPPPPGGTSIYLPLVVK